MIKTVFKKVNGKITREFIDEEDIKALRREHANPCSRCEFGYASRCPKIEGDPEYSIVDYNFITDGYQIYDGCNQTSELIIANCVNYQKDHPRKKPQTLDEILKLRHLQESIKILYFDAIDIEEANRIQNDLRNRGQLIDYETINDRNKVLKK